MTSALSYVLRNDATRTQADFRTLGDALEAVNRSVGERDHWAILEHSLDRQVVRCVAEGHGPIETNGVMRSRVFDRRRN